MQVAVCLQKQIMKKNLNVKSECSVNAFGNHSKRKLLPFRELGKKPRVAPKSSDLSTA